MSSTIKNSEFCKYRDKKVINTVDQINELITNYGRTNEKLNTYLIRHDKKKDVSIFKSMTFYVFTQIACVLTVCTIVFSIGLLIGNRLVSRSSIIHAVHDEPSFDERSRVELIKTPHNETYLKGDFSVSFNVIYDNMFMGTFISSVLLLYYPSNDIGLSPDEICYSEKLDHQINSVAASTSNEEFTWKNIAINKNSSLEEKLKQFDRIGEMLNEFRKEESLMFLNSSILSYQRVKDVIYMNDKLFDKLKVYPIAGSDTTMSPGLVQGLNNITVTISLQHKVSKANGITSDAKLLEYLTADCKKGRVYLQIHFVVSHIKTIFFRTQPQSGIFLPFQVPCIIAENTKSLYDPSTFRVNVIKNYNIQKNAIKHINFFIN